MSDPQDTQEVIQDIRRGKLVDWQRCVGKSPGDALKQIYGDAEASSDLKRSWYWDNIRNKRTASFWSRGLAFGLLVVGTALPLLAGLGDDAKTRLLCTQVAITLLAVAGLIQIADKAFGWSTGWMRYITTATAMESATTVFELAWAKHLLSKVGDPDAGDVQTLFALAEQFERDLIKLQTDETNGWITEFNAGIGVLDAAIKAQRDETQKQLDSLRAESVAARTDAKAQEKARLDAEEAARKAQEPGAIDLALTFKADPKPVAIELDGARVAPEFLGNPWASGKVSPGLHVIVVRAVAETGLQAAVSVDVKAGEIARPELKLPF